MRKEGRKKRGDRKKLRQNEKEGRKKIKTSLECEKCYRKRVSAGTGSKE